MAFPSTSFSRVTLFNHTVTVIRDDLLCFHGLNGNKARKLAHVALMKPFPKHIACSGGAQSNCMLAVAKLAAFHGSTFTYFTSHIPPALRHPSGNLREALQLGMKMQTIGDVTMYREMQTRYGWKDDTYWIPMGGDSPLAAIGFESLARNITDYVRHSKRSACILAEAGTGATAYYLHNALQQRMDKDIHHIGVLAIACATSPVSLEKKLQATHEADINPCASLPSVLQSYAPSHRFGTPKTAHLRIWRQLLGVGIPFDLIYAPRAWEQILRYWQENDSRKDEMDWMYLHSGGIEGNESMLERYKQTGLIQQNYLIY